MAHKDDIPNIPEQFGGEPTHHNTAFQEFWRHPVKTLLRGAVGMPGGLPAHSVRDNVDAAYNAHKALQAVDTAHLVAAELERREEQRFVAAENDRKTGGTPTQTGKGR
jgi:hypothetical protein